MLKRGVRAPEAPAAAVAPAVTPAEAAPQRITFRSLGAELIRSVTGVESRWAGTLSGLLRNAGQTVREYVDGVRSRYAHPVGYALATISAYVLTRQFLVQEGSIGALFDPVLLLGAVWPYVSFVLLIPAAWAMRALFRRTGLNAAECYVLMLYVAGQLALSEAAWVAASTLLPLPDWLLFGVRALQGLYATAAVVHFTGERRAGGWLRAAATVLVTAGIFYGALYAFLAWVVHSLFG